MGQVSQQATASDYISGSATSNGQDPLSMTLSSNNSAPLGYAASGDGVATDVSNSSASTEWQEFEVSSDNINLQAITVDNASQISVTSKPSSATSLSIGGVVVSDWASSSSGTNLVNQNNGWGYGWNSQPSGWGAPQGGRPPMGWKAPQNSNSVY